MAERVRVGIVGTSWYADLMHLPAVKSHPHADLVASCGRNRQRAQEMADKYGIPQVYTEAAKAVAIGVKTMTYFTWRWLPPVVYAHRLVQEGYLGRCYFAELRYVGGYGRAPTYRWKWDANRSLGILGDLGSHMIDLAHWLVGDIEQVSADLPMTIDRPGLDGQPLKPANDSAILSLRFKEGGHGVIHVSALAHQGDRMQMMQIVLHGAGGTIELDFDFRDGYALRGARADEDAIRPLPIPADILQGIDHNEPVMAQLDRIFTEQPAGTRRFVDAILTDTLASPSFQDGVKVQAVMAAALEADRKRCWVALQ